jgi:hypothetical protein
MATFRRKSGKLAAYMQNFPLTNSVIGWRKSAAGSSGAGGLG